MISLFKKKEAVSVPREELVDALIESSMGDIFPDNTEKKSCIVASHSVSSKSEMISLIEGYVTSAANIPIDHVSVPSTKDDFREFITGIYINTMEKANA